MTENVGTGHQFYWQGAGAYRIGNFKAASLYVELPVAFVPSQRAGTIGHLEATFVTPSLKAKFFPKAPLSPFATLGGGWARYSVSSISSIVTNTGALQFGGGLDVKTLFRRVALRFEVRDFMSVDPRLFAPRQPGFHRHNVLAGGGPVFTF